MVQHIPGSITIYGIGRNYVQHIAELNNDRPAEPVVFLKSRNSLRGLDSAPVAFAGETFAYEAELVLQMTRDFSLGETASWQDVEMFGLGIDLTRREVQNSMKAKGLPWTLAKSFLGSSIVGPFTKIKDEATKKALNFEFLLNGESKQIGAVRDMIWSVPEVLTYLNSFSPLSSGDIVFTGTPHGVGNIVCGDRFELSSPQLGRFAGQL